MFKGMFTLMSGVLLSPYCASQMVILVCLVIVELVLSVYLSLKYRRFDSHILLRTCCKFLLYFGVILTAVGIDSYFGFRRILVQGFLLPFLSVTEALEVFRQATELKWFERRFPRFSYWVRHG